jgi:hypothetical protein
MDPKWLYRAGLALVIVAFVVVIARMAFIGLKPDTTRLDRNEAAAVGKAPRAPPKQE